MMALVVESSAQQQFVINRKQRRVGRQHDDVEPFKPQCYNGEQSELVSGRLIMAGNWPVFARLYKTSAGQMLVLWPDKLYATAPVGCATLRDIGMLTDVRELTFTLTWRDSVPLTLRAPDVDNFEKWTATLKAGSCERKRRKYTSDSIIRLPMLVEEEI